jgi:hypothetical protein
MTDLLLTHFRDLIGLDLPKKLDLRQQLAWPSEPDQAGLTAPSKDIGVSLVIGIDQTDHSTN